MNANDHVQTEISKSNPWYVQEHLNNIHNSQQRRVIVQRWQFFAKVITAHQQKHAEVLRILDTGCGDGINLTFLSGLKGAHIFACDYNPLRVERARQHFPNVTISQQDLTCPDFGGQRFDVILCSQVLEHIPDDIHVLKNLKNLLRDDGLLILGVPNEGCLFAQLRNHLLQPSISRTTDHVHFYTFKQLIQLVNRADLRLLEHLQEGFFFFHSRLNSFFAQRDWGFRFMQYLNRVFPALSAGFYLVLVRKDARSVY